MPPLTQSEQKKSSNKNQSPGRTLSIFTLVSVLYTKLFEPVIRTKNNQDFIKEKKYKMNQLEFGTTSLLLSDFMP